MKRKQSSRLKFDETEIKFGDNYLTYSCDDLDSAKRLRRQFETEMANTSHRFEKGEMLITYPGGVLKVSAAMALSSSDRSPENISIITPGSIKKVHHREMNSMDLEMHRIMGRMIESDRPMFLLDNETDDQIWLNQLACNMIESSGDEAVRRSIKNYWESTDWKRLHQKLRDTSQPFEHDYRAILNDVQPDVWFSAVSRYEPVEIGGRSFRLSINQHFEIIGRAQLVTAS